MKVIKILFHGEVEEKLKVGSLGFGFFLPN